MDLRQLRQTVIRAIFSDDELLSLLVLKGGNALDFAYNLGDRATVDVDFSMPGDFEDAMLVSDRIQRVLQDAFGKSGHQVFDFDLQHRPRGVERGRLWGGYRVFFKLASNAHYERLRHDTAALRRGSLVVGPNQQRIFRIDISKYEYCGDTIRLDLEDGPIVVYSPPLMVSEKLRAICQQHPEYPLNRTPRERARDFLDIHALVTAVGVRILSHRKLLSKVFEAKQVPLELLLRLEGQREFHRVGWSSVIDSTSAPLEDFDFYFDFVGQLVRELEAAGHVNTPTRNEGGVA